VIFKICNQEDAAWQQHGHAIKEELSGNVANAFKNSIQELTYIFYSTQEGLFSKNT
jgi:hypothetical protein